MLWQLAELEYCSDPKKFPKPAHEFFKAETFKN